MYTNTYIQIRTYYFITKEYERRLPYFVYKIDDFTDIQASASSAIRNRKDFDPIVKHEFALTIVTAARYVSKLIQIMPLS